MEKILILNSLISGKRIREKKLITIKKLFETKYKTVNVVSTDLNTNLEDLLIKEKENIECLILIGGDGFVNKIINILEKQKFYPILGFLPGGTLSGFRKKLLCSSNLFKEAKNLLNAKPIDLPLISVNEKLALYFVSFGVYSDISYSTKGRKKKVFGYCSYYIEALKRIWKKQSFEMNFAIDSSQIKEEFPFFMLLDGTHIAGFKVNKEYKPSNPSLNLFITPHGLFNGLLKYLFGKVECKQCKEMSIFNEKSLNFCLDGESYIFDGYIDIKRVCGKFTFLANERFYTKYN